MEPQRELPEIQVRYSGTQPPTVTLPKELRDRIKITIIGPQEGRTSREESNLVLGYKNVSVYRTIRDRVSYSSYWFATKPSLSFESVQAFDSRRIPPASLEEQPRYEKLFPGDVIKQRIAYAIDLGLLTEHGYLGKL